MTDTPDTPDGADAVLADSAEPVAVPEPGLVGVVRELERHAAEAGWDTAARLFALVPTADLLAGEPGLAEQIGVDPDDDLTGSLTPVEQDDLPADVHLEALLSELMWPEEVHGTAVVVERLVLPPTVALPEDVTEAQALAATHPEREEVRMVAGATRAGNSWCALRLRSHDEDRAVLEGPDLVPALLELLHATLVPAETPPGLGGPDQ